jgi:hypothetical protein
MDPDMQLVFRGSVLDSDRTLSDSGLRTGSVIHVVPFPRCITVRVIPSFAESFDVFIERYSDVSEMRASISEELGVDPESIHLVHRGLVLQDCFTLMRYGLSESSLVFIAPVKRPPPKPRPSELLESLKSKLAKFVLDPKIGLEIRELIRNRILQSLSRIDPAVMQVFEDARTLLESIERPHSARQTSISARLNDLAMIKYEVPVLGTKTPYTSLPKTKRPPDEAPRCELNLNFDAKISEDPLPVWREPKEDDPEFKWNVKTPASHRFSHEIRVLKRMGFGNESVIRRALEKTSGNVTRAAKLLTTQKM